MAKDFFGNEIGDAFNPADGTTTSAKAPAPRATSPDGLTYLDTGEYTPLYYHRMRAMNDPTFEFHDPGFVPDDVRSANSRYKLDAASGLYYTEDNHGRRTYVGNDPARQEQALNTPTFTYNPTAGPAYDPFDLARNAGGGAATGAALGGVPGAVIGGAAGALTALPQANGGGAFLSAGDPLQMGGGQRIGTAAEAEAANAQYAATGSSVGAPLGGTGAPGTQVGGAPSAATQGAQALQGGAQDEFGAQTDETRAGIANAESALIDAINGIGRDDTQSQAARQDQQVALAKQSDLLDRILGFDPNAYAETFADNALARTTALARSTPGGAAARQAGVFAGLEQMPAIQAEAQRSAQTLENQRLNAAQAAVGKFGDLAYGVRGQDQAGEEFNAELTTEIASQFGDIYDTTSQTGVQMMRTFSDIYTETIRNTRGYAEMDSAERRALWDYELRSRGLDVELEKIRRNFPDRDPTDVWLERLTKAGAVVVSAKKGGLI